jgi:AraC-like DNA-binding protein
MDEDHLTGIESGADAYLEKPFNLEILLRVTSNLLKSRNILKNKYEGKEDLNEQIETVSLQSADEKLMNKMIEIINQNIDNSDLNVNMISQKIGISRVHLYRKTKELTNQTPHELIRNIRLKQAANLLSKQHYNITEVMYACGFNSSAFFSSTFKKFYGVSPTEYMKECKEKKE